MKKTLGDVKIYPLYRPFIGRYNSVVRTFNNLINLGYNQKVFIVRSRSLVPGYCKIYYVASSISQQRYRVYVRV